MNRMFAVLFIVIAMAVMVCGCNKPLNLPEGQGETIVTVEMVNSVIVSNSVIEFSCKSANVNYYERTVTLERVTGFATNVASTRMGNVSVEGSKFVLKLSSDSDYSIYIGDGAFRGHKDILPKLKR